MKSSIFLFTAFTLFFLYSCNDEGDFQKQELSSPHETIDESQRIINESNLMDYWLSPEGRTWKDVDALYKSVLEKEKDLLKSSDFKVTAGLDNFRAMAISCMIQVYHILDGQDAEATAAIALYARELAKLPTCSPELLYSMLNRLEGQLPKAEIAAIAKLGYDSSGNLLNAMERNGSSEYKARRAAREMLKSLL